MSITFTTFPNPAWKDKIDLKLKNHLASHTNNHQVGLSEGIYAHQETQLVGGAVFQRHSNILWIDALWVDTKFRRQGMGAKLIQQVIVFAKQHHMNCLQLNAYFPEARRFFQSCEFEEVTSIPDWKYGLTCYFMKKVL